MTSKLEISPNCCESPANWPKRTTSSRLGPTAQDAIGAALQALYGDLIQTRVPEAIHALIVELKSKENVCGG
jgi:hypothetical protein